MCRQMLFFLWGQITNLLQQWAMNQMAHSRCSTHSGHSGALCRRFMFLLFGRCLQSPSDTLSDGCTPAHLSLAHTELQTKQFLQSDGTVTLSLRLSHRISLSMLAPSATRPSPSLQSSYPLASLHRRFVGTSWQAQGVGAALLQSAVLLSSRNMRALTLAFSLSNLVTVAACFVLELLPSKIYIKINRTFGDSESGRQLCAQRPEP
jgi:hypothetical protein